MTVTIVAFNLKEIKSVYYQKFKTIAAAVNRFEYLLQDENVDFLSIRKIKEDEP